MTGKRKRRAAAFRAKVALEDAKQTRVLAELAKAYQVHPGQISRDVLSWRLSNTLDGGFCLEALSRGRKSSTPTWARNSRRGSTPAGRRGPASR